MDPTECLKRFITAVENDDPEEAADAYNDLSEWLEKGGFVPNIGREDLLQLMEWAANSLEQE